jgi:hypothetical protein
MPGTGSSPATAVKGLPRAGGPPAPPRDRVPWIGDLRRCFR